MNLLLISPEIALFGGALFILLADVFFAKFRKNFYLFSHLFALIGSFISLYLVMMNFTKVDLLFSNMFITNSFTSFAKAVSILLLSIVILFSIKFTEEIKKISAEFLSLMMIATVGGMVLVSANDFLTFYMGLELQALSLYLLAAINRASAKSSESGIKYFVLGSAASGILLFGISMIYGYSGTTNFSALTNLYHGDQSLIPLAVMFGFILVLIGMFFKISSAPFHMWTPDVYEGSAPIVTTFFATSVKFISVVALIKLFAMPAISFVGIDKILILVALISLAVGSFGAIAQKNLKRLLAYSSIGHMGFVLLGLASGHIYGYSSAVFYILVYAIISLGSFGFLNLITSADDKNGEEIDGKIFDISALSGLAKTNPVMAASFAILLFSTAGIPPFLGFFSKFYILLSAISSGMIIASIAAILFSVISAYYYLRMIKIMYFDEPFNLIKLDDSGNIGLFVFVISIANLALIICLNPIFDAIRKFVFAS